MIKFSQRLNSITEYYFSSKLREVKFLVDSGNDIINLGFGSFTKPFESLNFDKNNQNLSKKKWVRNDKNDNIKI